jgi:glucosamine kinase
VLVDRAGHECGRGQAASANPAAVGQETALAHIQSAVAQAAHQAGVRLPVAAACCGLAGVARPSEQAAWRSLLHDLATQVYLMNDAELTLEALPDRWGICLIAGTGSIALGRDCQGQTARAGGWGHILGDEGSGYDIGRRALQAVARAADGRGRPTSLQAALAQAWALASPQELISHVYPERSKAAIADVAPLVFQQAATGDPVARQILATVADELATSVLAVATRLELEGAFPLAMTGGVLLHQPALRATILRRVQLRHQVGSMVVVEDAALIAAQALAAGKTCTGDHARQTCGGCAPPSQR